LIPPDVWDHEVDKIKKEMPNQLLLGLSRPLNVPPHLEAIIHEGLRRIYLEAQTLASCLRRDFISARLIVDTGPPQMEIPDTSAVDVQWNNFGTSSPTDRVLGVYAFGLVKVAEDGVKTVLLRPKIISENLISSIQTRSRAKETSNAGHPQSQNRPQTKSVLRPSQPHIASLVRPMSDSKRRSGEPIARRRETPRNEAFPRSTA
jgi:hypothetical protein